ncbi:MAG: bifunctional DNA primase/polymerase [Nocardioidaceae bacterium]
MPPTFLRAPHAAGWSNSLRLSALDHASAGYPVLPLHPGTKEQIGRRLASTDLAQVDQWWWGSFPQANVGRLPRRPRAWWSSMWTAHPARRLSPDC